jgi:hypothetical protein
MLYFFLNALIILADIITPDNNNVGIDVLATAVESMSKNAKAEVNKKVASSC